MKYKEALARVKQSGWAIKDIPDNLLSIEICLAAVNTNALSVQGIPERLQTPEIYLLAVSRNGHALEYIPKDFRTADLCLYALARETSSSIEIYIPKHLKSIKKEEYEESLLRGKTIEELITHSSTWFRTQGQILLEKMK